QQELRIRPSPQPQPGEHGVLVYLPVARGESTCWIQHDQPINAVQAVPAQDGRRRQRSSGPQADVYLITAQAYSLYGQAISFPGGARGEPVKLGPRRGSKRSSYDSAQDTILQVDHYIVPLHRQF